MSEQARQQKIAEVRRLWNFHSESIRVIQEKMRNAKASGQPLDPNWARHEARVQLSRTLLDVMQQSGEMARLEEYNMKKLDEMKEMILDAALVDVPTAFLDMAQASTSKQ